MQSTTLPEAIHYLTEIHGSQAEAARAYEVDRAYWYRLLSGGKDWPSDALLSRMGLKRVVTYEWTRKPR